MRPSPSDSSSSPAPRFRATYLVALGAIAVAAIGGHATLAVQMTRLHGAGSAIDLAGQQCFVEQRLSGLALRAARAIETGNGPQAVALTEQAANIFRHWRADQQRLLGDDPAHGPRGSAEPATAAAMRSLEPDLRQAGSLFDELGRLARNEPITAHAADAHQAALAIGAISDRAQPILHARVESLRQEADATLHFLSGLSALLGIVTVGSIAAAALVAFEPLLRRLARAQAAATQRAAEFERLAEVARRTTNAVVMTDLNRRIVWANEGFERISGYRIEEALGRSPGELLQCSRTDPAAIAAIRAACAAGRPIRTELLNRSKNGTEYWIDLNIQPQRDAAGVLTGFVAIESDITSIVRDRERLRSTVTSLAEGVVYVDATGVIADCNPAAERILGLTRDQICGRAPTDPQWCSIRLDGSALPIEEVPVTRTLRTRSPVRNFVHGIRQGDAIRWVSVSTEPISRSRRIHPSDRRLLRRREHPAGSGQSP
jgi:PAS domain S-box-containing protein